MQLLVSGVPESGVCPYKRHRQTHRHGHKPGQSADQSVHIPSAALRRWRLDCRVGPWHQGWFVFLLPLQEGGCDWRKCGYQ